MKHPMPLNFTPHKPCQLDSLDQLNNYPYYVMPKLDGLRCILHKGQTISNSLKPFPNKHLREHFQSLAEYCVTAWVEGELVMIDGTLQDVQSVVMSEDKPLPESLKLVIFDRPGALAPHIQSYQNRLGWVNSMKYTQIDWRHLNFIEYRLCYNRADVELYEAYYVERGYEGIVLRSHRSVYKFGRATAKEDNFWKLKRTEDAEAKIIEVNELEHNLNPEKINERGYTERSSRKENRISSNIAGSLHVEGINGKYKGKIFRVSLGSCRHSERLWFWQNRGNCRDRIVTYTYAKHRGTSDAPAEPRFKCFRAVIDLESIPNPTYIIHPKDGIQEIKLNK